MFAIACRTLVALVFLTAAWAKLRHWTVFQGVVANYQLLPDVAILPVARALPPIEAALGIALLWGAADPWTEAIAAALLLAFAAAMAINLHRGRRHIDCGCFQSALKQPLSGKLVGRNVVLALCLALPVLGGGAPVGNGAAAVGLLAGAVLFVILQSLNILWSIVPAWRQTAPHAAALRT